MATKVRVAGSNFTTFNYNGQAIAWLTNVSDSGPGMAGAGGSGGYSTVFALGAYHPVEIVTSRVLDTGQLTFDITELWNEPAWQQLQGLAGTNNIAEIMRAQASSPTPITAQMIIKPPGSTTWRGWTYNNLTIINVTAGETVSIGSMVVPRTITALYTHRTPLNTSGPPVY